MTSGADRDSPVERLVPTWLENVAALGWRVLVILALAVVLWYLAMLIGTVVASIGVAVIVAIILAPLVLRLRAGGRSRTSAAGIAWAVTVGVVLAVFVLLAIALLPYVADIVEQAQTGQEEAQTVVADLNLPEWLNIALQDAIDNADTMAGDGVARVADLVGILVLATFLLFFFLRDGDKAWLWLFQSLGEEKLEAISSAGDQALEEVGSYVRSTSVVAAVAAVTSYLIMFVMGVPLAFPLALLTFVTAYIPYFGGAIAAAVILLVTLGALGSEAAAVMALLLLVRWLVVRLTVRPRLYGTALSLHPAFIIIVLPIGYAVGGLAGLILAVPFAAIGLSVANAVIHILDPESPESLPDLVPGWLDRAAQWSWRALVAIALTAVVVAVLLTVPLVVFPLILGLIFAATIQPLVDGLVRRGQSRGTATIVGLGSSTIALVGVLVLALVSIVEQADELAASATDGVESADEATGGYMGAISDTVAAGTDAAASSIGGLSDELLTIGLVVLLGVLLTFYFLRDGARLWESLMTHFPVETAREMSAAGGRAYSVLGGYMVGTGAISFVGAGSQAVIMWVLGLPLVLPVFVLSFFGGFIPYIGSLLTTLLAFFIAVSVGDPIDILIMGLWTLLFNIIQGNVVAPMVYGRTTHIHPAIALAAIPAGSAVAGILGMFLVVPALGVVSATWRSVLMMLGSDEDELPGPPPSSEAVEAAAEADPDLPAEDPDADDAAADGA